MIGKRGGMEEARPLQLAYCKLIKQLPSELASTITIECKDEFARCLSRSL